MVFVGSGLGDHDCKAWVPRVPVRKSGDRLTVLSDADACALCLSRVIIPIGGYMVTVQESAFQDVAIP